jgi:hypothetical protein
MTRSRKRCLVCHAWFSPRPQNPHQATCSKAPCQKNRHRKACLVWNKKHPRNDQSRRAKIRAWARAFPYYWQRYRAEHPDYRQHDNARRKRLYQVAAVSAKQDVWSQIAVDKLSSIAAVCPDPSAKQDAWDRRVDGVLAYLLWKERSANQDAIVLTPRDA